MAISRGEVMRVETARLESRRLAAASRLDALIRSGLRCDGMRRALELWSLVVHGRPAGLSEAEADGMMGSHRESRRLAKQLAAAREELREQSAANQSAASRLKAERRQAAAARQERDTSQASAASLREEAAEARRREEAAKAALASAKRELAEVRRAYAHAKEERQHSEQLRDTQQAANERVTQQRDVALQEVGALAQELESLQVALASPQRPPYAAPPPSRTVGRGVCSPGGPSTSHLPSMGGAPPSATGGVPLPTPTGQPPLPMGSYYQMPSAYPSPRPGATAVARPARA